MRRSLMMLPFAIATAAVAQVRMTNVQTVAGSGQVDGTTQTEDVKFKNDAFERMTVPVRLGGQGPFRFMVDTGADRTAVSRQLAARLRLAKGESAMLHSISGASNVTTATLDDLQLTKRSLKVIDAPLLDDANIGADGILGVDSLRSQRVQFDFQKGLMSIVPSINPDPINDDKAIVIVANRRNGRLVLTEARVNGRKVVVVLDTGSQVSIGNLALRQLMTSDRRVQATQPIQLQSVTGDTLNGDYTFIRDLDLGDVELHGLALVFADAHTFGKLGLNDRPAMLLGMNAIRAFKKVSIDFARREFRVVVPESSARDVELASGSGRRARRVATF